MHIYIYIYVYIHIHTYTYIIDPLRRGRRSPVARRREAANKTDKPTTTSTIMILKKTRKS